MRNGGCPDGSAGRQRRAQHAHRFLALRPADPVEHQNAVQVVDLVLNHARLQPGGLNHQRLSVFVERIDADVHRTLDVDVHRRQAEAALLKRL